MGIINFEVPEKKVKYLKEILNLQIFVEGGTYVGDTALKMSKIFDRVYNIEKSDAMFNIAMEKLKNISNVFMLKGDTRDHLRDIISNNDNILYWLDAHWSGGLTYGENDECPLLDELEIIFSYDRNQVILIDDARLFLAPPPKPHNFVNWPTIMDIVEKVQKNFKITIYEDVIFLYKSEVDPMFRKFLQDEITKEWQNQNKFTFISKIFKRLGIY